MKKRQRRLNPIRIGVLVLLIGAGVYVNQVVVPTVPPPFLPTPTMTRAPESFIADAERLVSEGKLFQAVETYKNAIASDPANAANYIAIARQQIYLGQYQDAIDNLGKSLLINESNPMAYALRGWALGFQGNYLEAIVALKRSIELSPNNAVAYAYLAEVYGMQYESNPAIIGVIDDAINSAAMARDLDPNSLETLRARGYVQWLLANYTDAIQFYMAAIAINPYIADLHIALGIIFSSDAVNDIGSAKTELTEADLLNPANPEPDFRLSLLYQKNGEYATAIQYAEKAIVDDPYNPFYYGNLGTLYYRSENYQKAAEILGLLIHGGLSEAGVLVEPMPLDYGTAAAYFARYGISQARLGECDEAAKISQAILDTVGSEETNVYNANEILTICQQTAGSASQPTTTPEIEATIEP